MGFKDKKIESCKSLIFQHHEFMVKKISTLASMQAACSQEEQV